MPRFLFGYNYIDKDLDITHDHDSAGEHGSHVEGIAAANAFLSNGDGSFSRALETVKVQGVAPRCPDPYHEGLWQRRRRL